MRGAPGQGGSLTVLEPGPEGARRTTRQLGLLRVCACRASPLSEGHSHFSASEERTLRTGGHGPLPDARKGRAAYRGWEPLVAPSRLETRLPGSVLPSHALG